MNRSYSKKEKLKSQKLIEALFEEGKAINAFPLRLIYLKTGDSNKIGVSVSKRNFKRAFDRNRIKRLMRESYRLNKNLLIDNNIDGYAFMILYIGKEMPDFELVFKTTKILFKNLINILSRP